MLNKQEKQIFLKLARTEEGKVLRDYIQKLVDQLSDIDSITGDAIKDRQFVKQLLNTELLSYFHESKTTKKEDDSWE